VLMSGNHAKIAQWRLEMSEKLTKDRRPDLWAAHQADRKKP
jgi:tRNA (guanine37-N1)-methyltransferase